jgi:drug/metabolite transporter (DMT)-like permease
MNLNRATLSGLLAIFVWSLSPLFISYTTALPLFLVTALILGFAFLTFVFRWIVTRAPIAAYVDQPLRVWILGFYGVTLYGALFISGLKLAPIAEANLCNYIWPPVVVIFAAFLDHRGLRWFHVCGTGLSILGLIVLTRARTPGGFALHLRLGHVLAFAGGIVWGTYSVLAKRLPQVDSNVTGVYCGMGSVVLLAISLASEKWPTLTFANLWPVLVCGAISHTGYYFWDIAMKRGDTLLVGAASFLTPIVSTLWLLLFGRASFTGSLWLAILLVPAGGALAVLDRVLRLRADSI